MLGFLRGTVTALVTPFTKSGEVNYHCLEEMIEAQIKAGVSAVVVLGSTGEPWALSKEERERIIRCALSAAAGRAKVVVGTGHADTARAVEDSIIAQKLGADGLLCVTPYYNKCNTEGVVRYFERIARAVELPVVCYNVPARTGVNITPEAMKQISKFDNIAGIKEASGNMAQIVKTAKYIRHKCNLYAGDDLLTLPILAAGGSAVISVASNLAPRQMCMMVRAFFLGNYVRANKMQDKLLPLFEACALEPNPIPVKAGLELLGFDAGDPRPPLLPLSPAKRRKLDRALALPDEALL